MDELTREMSIGELSTICLFVALWAIFTVLCARIGWIVYHHDRDQFLISEDFEGCGEPVGWSSSEEPDWDYTAKPIEGGKGDG